MYVMEEQSLFIEFMGDSPTVRVFDYLMTERDLDFSITDMAKNAKIGRATLYRIWDNLVQYKIILPTRKIGKAKLYRLNIEDPKIKKLIEIDDMLVEEDLRTRAQKEICIP
jgi:phage antirepressor YoqD-like protein